MLCNLAGELAEANGQSGEAWFLRVAALLTSLPEPYQVLSRILIACVAGMNNNDECYSLDKAQLLSVGLLEVKEALHDHLTDLERYGQRGLIQDWHVYHTIAAEPLPPEENQMVVE